MDDQDRQDTRDDNSAEGEGVPVPSRIRDIVDDARQRLKDELDRGRDVVREYEERYYGPGKSRLETPPAGKPPESSSQVYAPAKPKRQYGEVSENERKWAALAHASTLLTALVGLPSAGMGVLITMFVPLLIYFAFRKRSEFVAFHALQAFTIQLIGTIGWMAVLVVGGIIWVALLIISALLVLVLIGIVLLPIVALAGVLALVVSLALPLGMIIYSMIAAVETWSGHNYRIPYIGRWVESQMYSEDPALF
jgi:uncharacterized Tic20 family protein